MHAISKTDFLEEKPDYLCETTEIIEQLQVVSEQRKDPEAFHKYFFTFIIIECISWIGSY